MPSVPANVCGVAGEAAKAAALGLPRPAPVAGASERLPGSVSGYTFRRCECDGICVPIRVTASSPTVSPCVRGVSPGHWPVPQALRPPKSGSQKVVLPPPAYCVHIAELIRLAPGREGGGRYAVITG